jgi:hypothetical protein
MPVENYRLSGGQLFLPPPLFQQLCSNHEKLTAKQVIAYSKADPKKYSDGEVLYFCVRNQGSRY